MTNKCNEWECPYNKNGKCSLDECASKDIWEVLENLKANGEID